MYIQPAGNIARYLIFKISRQLSSVVSSVLAVIFFIENFKVSRFSDVLNWFFKANLVSFY